MAVGAVIRCGNCPSIMTPPGRSRISEAARLLPKHYVGRPSPALFRRTSDKDAGGARIYLKGEDLNHTGAHKINNCIGQALLAKRMGKPRIIAETGAGQHGVATATARGPVRLQVPGLHGRGGRPPPEAQRLQDARWGPRSDACTQCRQPMHFVASNKMLRGLPSMSLPVGTRLPYSRWRVSAGLIAIRFPSNRALAESVVYHLTFTCVN